MSQTHATAIWLSEAPRVLYTACWELGVIPALGNTPLVHFHNPGAALRGSQLAWRAERLAEIAPAWTSYVIASERGAAQAAAHPRVVWAHEHAILSRTRWQPQAVGKSFDACMIAATQRWKRHELAVEVPRLAVLSQKHAAAPDYADGELEALLPNAVFPSASGTWVGPEFVVRLYNQSHCNLVLSGAEGGSRTTGEAQLCGIPIVSTSCRGGRLETGSAPFMRVTPAEPPAIAAAVAEFVANPPAPADVRAAFLETQAKHRETLEELAETPIAWDDLPHIGAWACMATFS